MRKRERDIRQLIDGCDLECESLQLDGGQHYIAIVKAPDGATSKFTMSNTPSDHRGDLNKRADMRRFARQHACETA